MRRIGILALVFTIGLAGSALAQTKIFLLTNPSNSWGTLSQVGGSLDVIGKFNKQTSAPADRPIAWNTSSSFEYTFHMTGMTLDAYIVGSTSADYDSSKYGAGGTISIYEGTPANATSVGTNPPNAETATFTDGTVVLSGVINDLNVMKRDATGSGPDSTGEARGSVTFTGGTRLSELTASCTPVNWVFNVAVGTNFFGSVPAGYNLRWSGELLKNPCPPTATEPKSWGLIKALYN
jgi:hypothetical protein